MTDKKSCENCWYGREHLKPSQVPCPHRRVDVCGHWLRNPRKWLAILPTEPGWYWFRKNEENGITKITQSHFQAWKESNDWVKTFKWQGPIRPEGE